MPISRVRYATAAYIVFIAPKHRADRENQGHERAEHADDRRQLDRLFGVVVQLALGLQVETGSPVIVALNESNIEGSAA